MGPCNLAITALHLTDITNIAASLHHHAPRRSAHANFEIT
jgi:hypothetical protein